MMSSHDLLERRKGPEQGGGGILDDARDREGEGEAESAETGTSEAVSVSKPPRGGLA